MDKETEVILKALEDHGKAVADFKQEVKSNIDSINDRIGSIASGKKFPTIQEVMNGGLKKGQFADVNTGDIYDEKGNLMYTKSTPVDGIVEKLTTSDQFGMLKQKSLNSTGRITLDGMEIKSITNNNQGIAGSRNYPSAKPRLDGLYNDPRRELTLLNLLPTLPVDGAAIEYVRISNYVNTAAFQTEEGQKKAQFDVDLVPETANIATIAHWARASVQVLDDSPALGRQIQSLLEYGVLAKLEAEIVGGAGGRGKITGLLELGTDFASFGATDTTTADKLGAAVLNLRANGWNAGLIILNPVDWHLISSSKNDMGEYVLGSPRDPSPPSLWGVPVVLTPSLARNVAIVLDPAQVAILDRQMPTLMVSREDGDNFVTNMVTILGELRAGLAVFAAGAVLILDITPAGVKDASVPAKAQTASSDDKP